MVWLETELISYVLKWVYLRPLIASYLSCLLVQLSRHARRRKRGHAAPSSTACSLVRRGIEASLELLVSLVTVVGSSPTTLGAYVTGVVNGSLATALGSTRELFPLPVATRAANIWPLGATLNGQGLLLHLVNSSVAGLNHLHAAGNVDLVRASMSAVQRATLLRVGLSWWRLAKHMTAEDVPIHVPDAYQWLVDKAKSSLYAPLTAECVDMPLVCGQVDTDTFLPDEVKAVVHDTNAMFHDDVDDCHCDARFRGSARAEYVMLVRRQCRAFKVGLMRSCQHVAPVFSVRKKDTSRLREVWDGGVLSRHTVAPPPLPFMTTPAALSTLESSDDRPLLHSCRDGETFFDQLRLLDELRTFAGRPSVTVAELCDLCYKGAKHPMQEPLTSDELRAVLADDHDASWNAETVFYPVGLVWPMGHSWSAAVAQHVMTGSCLEAGADTDQFLCDERHLASADKPAAGVVIDDVNLFERSCGPAGDHLGPALLRDLDHVWTRHRIQNKVAKQRDRQLNGMALGMELVRGKWLLPKRSRLTLIVGALIELITVAHTSPKLMSSFIGSLQWVMLSRRPLLSCFHEVYAFTLYENDVMARPISKGVIAELGLLSTLLFSLVVDLRADWAPVLGATDGAENFGYGGCWAKISPQDARRVAAVGSGFDQRVVPSDVVSVGMQGAEARAAEPAVCILPCARADFSSIFSIKCEHNFHASKLEIGAFSLYLRHLARSVKWHGRRLTVLTDSLATLFCIQKGRTSAPNMRLGMAQIAATSLACGMMVHPVYINTLLNPANDESRGVKRTVASPTPRGSFHQAVHEAKRACRRFRAAGYMPARGGAPSWDSSCSSSVCTQPSH